MPEFLQPKLFVVHNKGSLKLYVFRGISHRCIFGLFIPIIVLPILSRLTVATCLYTANRSDSQ